MNNRLVMFTNDAQIDRRILLQADSLQAAGWQVTIVGLPQPGVRDDPRVARARDGGPNPMAWERLVLRVYRGLRSVLGAGPLLTWLRSIGWRYFLDQEKFFVRLYAQEVAQYPADVVVAHDLPMLPVAMHAARTHGAKVVYDSHELFAEQEFSTLEKGRWRAMEAKFISRCDLVTTVNPSIARELQARYGLDRVGVIYNAERCGPLPARERRFHTAFGLPPASRVLLFQGGFSVGRQLEHLVAAMASVRTPDVHLVLLGDGQLRQPLQQQLAAAGLLGRVHLHPAVPQSELLAWTAAADAGVIPYQPTCLNNLYCTPNKLFEFIAAGLPILASDLPEIRAIVSGHGIGQLADLSSTDTIARAIDEFFADPARLEAWRGAVMRARKLLNWDVEGAKVVQLYESLR